MSISRSVSIGRWRGGRVSQDQDEVAVEQPVALVFNGVSHAVMLATPADLEDFALGFALTEGIIAARHELYDSDIELTERGILLHLRIAAERFARLQERRRSLAGRTGCGLCGTDSLDQVVRDLPPVSADHRFSPDILQRAAQDLTALQMLQQRTGASHAAAWISAAGEILLLREDVGRHNALDKLIGAMSRDRIDPSQGAVLVTSRASYEMVQKTVALGAPLLAAVSAPTSLAIERAVAWNLTLVGFLRAGSHVAYSHDWRLNPVHPQEKIA